MTPGKEAGKTKHLILFHSLHLDFYVKTAGNREIQFFAAYLMRAKYTARFFSSSFLLVCEEGRANCCYFPPEK